MIGEGVRVEVEHTNKETNKDANTNTDTNLHSVTLDWLGRALAKLF